ncbi:hypothetical protein CapIbe_018931 [Capra ibex]
MLYHMKLSCRPLCQLLLGSRPVFLGPHPKGSSLLRFALLGEEQLPAVSIPLRKGKSWPEVTVSDCRSVESYENHLE